MSVEDKKYWKQELVLGILTVLFSIPIFITGFWLPSICFFITGITVILGFTQIYRIKKKRIDKMIINQKS